jgi:hypothetical protein
MSDQIPPLTCQLCGNVFPEPYATPCPCDEAKEPLPVSADTIIAMAANLPPWTFRVWLDAHDG